MGETTSTPIKTVAHGHCSFNNAWTIPLAGNAFITACDPNHTEVITDYGLGNWMSPETVTNIYFHVSESCEAQLALRLKVPFGTSTIKVTLKCADNVTHHEVILKDLTGSEYHTVTIGNYPLCKVGYMKLELKGVHTTGGFFADVSDLMIQCLHEIRCVADDFYFGRRGPSIHLKYQLPCNKNISYFYNEIIVPQGEDAIGAYFCAAGFDGGYFGIQVNSTTERRILFSIWSPYNTDNPACIPDEYKVRLSRKGDNVYVGEFGNEGSGGQSFLRYNWKPETKYKFLVNATPSPSDRHTQFTAWFWSPDQHHWMLIASFVRPMDCLFLRNLYSFSENFLPETGHICRMARFGNQWIRDCHQNWHEITAAQLTGDATSERNRQDFAGGVVESDFYLKNCGFFNATVELNQNFERCSNNTEPFIDFHTLP
ncbi:uncharacterized protein LOC119084337 isoform X2 [Bradysia coprophila]|uniref:uncharacterized protein LOC119084337 isoform X2 n=1 Tax=Bradysia coprophila TaxID=38358 RepID=UPI00187D968D|nr:uncharacterized protein LOC119084337 isoform X2 [Bradysia coprophila]